ncbi:MAG: hypothetical protein QOF39_2878 [Frankiales bacterium]|jgi:uncharacterized paraquat-inducible protein A|nr:hypothetical protein [Frankiales bacterium]
MSVLAWCGRCGESFPLLELVDSGTPGSCPRCGVALAPEYAAVMVSAVRQVIAAAAVLEQSGTQLADVAPLLHIDRRALAEELEGSLDH